MIPPAERDARLVARYRRVLAALVVLLIAAELLAIAGVAPEPFDSVWGPHGLGQFFAMALLGTFALHLSCRPSRREAQATLALAAVFELARALVQHALGWEPRWIVLSTGFGAGLASLTVLAVLARHDLDRRVLLLAGVIVPFAVLLSNSLVELTTALHPLTLDALVYAFDGSLGLQPSFVVGRLFARLPALARVSELVYLATPFGFAVLWAAQRRARTPAPIDVMTAFLVATGAGFALYHAFPVAGPIYVVGDGWPVHPPAIADMGLEPGYAQAVARNCMPSLHTTWVLLLAWHSRGRGVVVRVVAALFLTFTLLATLGEGLHYLADLVVAFPFALSAQAVSAPASPARRRILVVAALAVLAWMVLLRAGVLVRAPSLLVSWLLVLVTVASSLWLERRLQVASARALETDAPEPWRAPATRGAWAWLAAGAGAALALLLTPATVSVSLPGALLAFAVGAFVGERVGALGHKRAGALLGERAGALLGERAGALLGERAGPLLGERAGGASAAHAVGASAAVLAAACAVAPWLPWATYAAVLATGAVLAALARRAPPASVLAVALLAAAFATVASEALVPALGLMRSDWLAAAVALAVTAAGRREDATALLARGAGGAAAPHAADVVTAAESGGANVMTAAESGGADVVTAAESGGADVVTDGGAAASGRSGDAAQRGVRAVLSLAFAGVAAFAFVAAYRPLLGFVVGDSVYALAATRAAFAGGAALGVFAVAAARAAGARVATVRVAALALLAAALAAGGLGWRALGHYFASFAAYSISHDFAAHEIARHCAAAVAIMPPAAAAAAALACFSDGGGARAGRAWAGFALAGALATVSVAALLPSLGAWRVAQLAAALAALAAVGARISGGATAVVVASAAGAARAAGRDGAFDTVARVAGPAVTLAVLVVALVAIEIKAPSLAAIAGGSYAAFELPPCGAVRESVSNETARGGNASDGAANGAHASDGTANGAHASDGAANGAHANDWPAGAAYGNDGTAKGAQGNDGMAHEARDSASESTTSGAFDSASDATAIATRAVAGDGARLCANGRLLLAPAAPGAGLDAPAAALAGNAFVVGAPPPAGFAHVDALTRSPAAARLLARHHAAWQVRAGDVRAALLAAPGRYDLISLARPASLSPDDAALFSRELFAAAAQALSPRGRLAVALPLARTSPRALAAIVSGARAAFADVTLLLPTDKLAPATLLGCRAACPRAGQARGRDALGRDALGRDALGRDALGRDALDGDALDRYRAAVAARGNLTLDELAAEADAEALAWSLPRAVVSSPTASWQRNRDLLSAFAAHQ